MALSVNEARLRFVTTSPSGPVGRFLSRQGVRSETAAKLLATQEQLVRTGGYRNSIKWRLQQGASLVLVVFSDSPHAGFIERGTDPHPIRPRNKKMLWWEHGADRGWFVPEWPRDYWLLTHGVNHPGTPAYRILGRAVRQVFLGS